MKMSAAEEKLVFSSAELAQIRFENGHLRLLKPVSTSKTVKRDGNAVVRNPLPS